ncbi:hypothetical protein CLRAG_35460 [Clostridium ragsdalei P11]|uniref:Preprotein translocase subunit SecA n=1 Tax=Clostridium ragsdalei P11 TaxID=1353534 RepID=A0A1A6AK52_9CLOT|nr:SEC-C metal-binding domain-containing protein [Clostridium ragsdalei]OBR90368.1 hypothetical protein CLRAG_35460 [Clostridium ragsdalei P11]
MKETKDNTYLKTNEASKIAGVRKEDELENFSYEDEDEIIKSELKKELKSWKPIEEDFSLEYHLNRLTKAELLNIARNLYINKISSLKKEELKNRILEFYEEKVHFLIENIDVERFEFLIDLARKKFCKVRYTNIQINDIGYFRDMAFLFTGILNGEDVIIMPEELQKIVLNKDNKSLRDRMENNGQVIKLFWGMCNYYGVIHIDDFKQLIKKYIDFDLSSMDLKVVLENGAAYYNEFEYDGNIGNDALVDNVDAIFLKQHKRIDLDFYPFKKEELLAAARADFQDKTKAYKRFYSFLINNFDIDVDVAEDLIFSLEADIKNNEKISEAISDFLSNFQLSNVNESSFIGSEVIKFANNIRQWIIKGYTPAELSSSTVVNKKKIGRNDPCPCGSGKKYKKCCGRG